MNKSRVLTLLAIATLFCLMPANTALAEGPTALSGQSLRTVTSAQGPGTGTLPTPEPVWVVESVAPSVCYFANVSLVLGADDVPHLSYGNADTNSLMYATRSGADWESVEVDQAAAVASSIDLDSSGQPHIAYRNAISNSLQYAIRNNGGWDVDIVGDTEVGWAASLRVDAGDAPNIAYLDSGQEPKFARWNGTQWEIELISPDFATWASMDMDSAGQPHVAYANTFAANHAVFSGTTWITDTIDGKALSGQNAGMDVSIAVDDRGVPHVSYARMGDDYMAVYSDGLRYAVLQGSEWVSETVEGPGQIGALSSIAVDGAATPHISYYDADNNTVKYAVKAGGTWTIAPIAYEAQLDGKTAIALDGEGRPHVAYCDTGSGEVRYARLLDLPDRIALPVMFGLRMGR